MSHLEFVQVHSIVHSGGTHRSAICLVKLLGIGIQVDLDSNGVAVAVRTRNRSIFLVQQCYVAINTIQALAVVDGPAAIHTVNDL